MAMDNDKQMMIDLLKELREDQKELKDTSTKHTQESMLWQAITTTRLDSIDVNLEEHMRRTKILEELHKDNENRIEQLEKPGEVFATIKKWAMWVGGIAGSAVAIAKLFGLF